MLAASCQQCGATTPVALASEALRCAHCHHEGPYSPAVHARVVAARQVLGELASRERQLSSSQARSLSWAGIVGALFVVFMALVAIGLMGFPLLLIIGSLSSPYPLDLITILWLFVPSAMPVVLFVLPSIAYAVWLRRRRLAAEARSAAIPPQREGEPARCHVCGGPVAAQGARAVARCGYCQADNVVTRGALARAAAQRREVLEDFAMEVRRQAAGNTGLGLFGVLAQPVLAVAGVVLVGALWVGAVYAAVTTEGPVDRRLKLAWVKVPRGTCLATYLPGPKKLVVGDDEQLLAIPRGARFFTADHLVGKRLIREGVLGLPDEKIVVRRAYSSPFMPGSAHIVYDSMKTGEEGVASVDSGLCQPAATP